MSKIKKLDLRDATVILCMFWFIALMLTLCFCGIVAAIFYMAGSVSSWTIGAWLIYIGHVKGELDK